MAAVMTPPGATVTLLPERCEKCGQTDIATQYHARHCHATECSFSRCWYGSHSKRHDEHLHRTCRTCGYDWTQDVVGEIVIKV